MMAIPPWTYGLLRRGIVDVAKKASETETVERLKKQASELLQDLPEAAAKGIDAVLKKTDLGKKNDGSQSSQKKPFEGPIINASGTLFHPLGTGSSMPTSAIELSKELLASDISSSMINQINFQDRIQKLIPEDIQHSICITHNITSAITLLATRNPSQTILIDKTQQEVDINGLPLSNFLERLTNTESLDKSDGANTARDTREAHSEFVAQTAPSSGSSQRVVGDQVARILLAETCSLEENPPHRIPSCWSLLRGDFDWMILPGNTIAGGPDCGLIIGPKEEVDQLRSHHLWPCCEASEITMLMMLVTMEIGRRDPDSIPVHALLRTSLDNIRSRTERLATRIGCNERIVECQTTEGEARLRESQDWTLPSQQLRLRHQSMEAEKWCRLLSEDYPSILSSIEDHKLCIDLRWVHPADDAKLGEILGGEIR